MSGEPGSRRTTVVLVLGVALTLVAWAVLVFVAIAFGRAARAGQSSSWALLGVATLGAALCLVMTLLLGARLRSVRRGDPQPQRRTPGRRRAGR